MKLRSALTHCNCHIEGKAYDVVMGLIMSCGRICKYSGKI